jgi:hypothetical protein
MLSLTRIDSGQARSHNHLVAGVANAVDVLLQDAQEFAVVGVSAARWI